MGFTNGAFATVWEIEPHEKFTKVRLNVSQKNLETNEYRQTFSGYVSFIGEAHNNINSIKPKDKIQLIKTDVTTRWDKARQQEFVNYQCYEFEKQEPLPGKEKSKSNSKSSQYVPNIPENVDEELPFN